MRHQSRCHALVESEVLRHIKRNTAIQAIRPAKWVSDIAASLLVYTACPERMNITFTAAALDPATLSMTALALMTHLKQLMILQAEIVQQLPNPRKYAGGMLANISRLAEASLALVLGYLKSCGALRQTVHESSSKTPKQVEGAVHVCHSEEQSTPKSEVFKTIQTPCLACTGSYSNLLEH